MFPNETGDNYTVRYWRVSPWKRTMTMLVLWLAVVKVYGTASVEYANQWTVEIDGNEEDADNIASANGFWNHGKVFEDENIYLFSHPRVLKRSLRHSDEHHASLTSHRLVRSVEQQVIKKRVKRDVSSYDPETPPADPLWAHTWYLHTNVEPNMKVVEAWKAGYTGKDVVVTILDDGIEYTHPDLAENYDPKASKDINNHDDDPMPRPTYNNENRHGTRCAGEVAAVANNEWCSIGIAYDAKIGGVRMLDGAVTDAVEALSIGLNPGHIDIYSASWGPDDDGRTVDGPAKQAKAAFKKGITQGRGGKGSIFVWASGNGGRKHDNCNCDGYTNSIYTLSISSTTQNTNKPWYSEDCSSTLATTYSSGISSEKQIVTTDLDKKCTETHTGTSASAPLAAGICALALEANRDITWRDMQHIVVRTANPDLLKANDWVVNGAGRKVSHSYGYGMMDAHAMATMAKSWTTVPAQRNCSVTVLPEGSRIAYSTSSPYKKTFKVSGCSGVKPDGLEHVQAVISASSDRRGDMHIYLTSPSGTKSTLLDSRAYDDRSGNFHKWPFMTTHSWDEDPDGEWVLEIETKGNRGATKGFVEYFELVIFGTLNKDWPSGLLNGEDKNTASTTDVAAKVVDDKSVRKHQSTTPGNCKARDEAGRICLACEDAYALSVDRTRCIQRCPRGQYLADEKTGEKVPRESDQDRSAGFKICRLCAPHCDSCNGSNIRNCKSCESGFKMAAGRCVSEISYSQTNVTYALTVSVCVLSVILFGVLFVCLHFCRGGNEAKCCVRGDSTQYSYVPNHSTDGELGDGRRRDVKFVNGNKWGAVDSAKLLSDSEDEGS